jgi:hypothetical protein
MHPIWFSFCLLFFQGSIADPPTPTLLSVEPSSVQQGTTVGVTFRGSGFVPRQTWPEMPVADSGGFPGLGSAGAAQFPDESTMTVLWRVMAPAGKYYVDLATSPPYVSPRRSNLLPFTILPSAIPSIPEYEVTTFAGKPGGPGAADGWREGARFVVPGGIWGDGRFLYVSDNQTMRRVEISTGLVTTIAGAPYIKNYADGKGGEARLNGPGPVWGDGTNLYVLEASSGGASTLRKIALATGEVTTAAPRGQFMAMEMSGFGRVLYSSQGRTISGFDPDSGQNVFAVALEQVDFPVNTPIGSYSYGNRSIPLWSDGKAVYVVDNGSNDVSKPRSLIRRIDLTTLEITAIAGSPSQIGYADGAGMLARFHFPSALWGDGSNLYVVDSGNHIIRKIELATQQVSTLAGFPQPQPYVQAVLSAIDGPASTARFALPGRIWGDSAYLYVTDLFAIRRVTIATGDVVTIAGSSWATGADDGTGSAARFVNAGNITGTKNILYVLDGRGSGALRRINTANVAEVQTIGYIPAQYAQPIWADETNVYTVDPNTGLVQTFELSTGTIRPLASLPSLGVSPVFYYRSMWGDGANLYIGGNKKIYKVVIATGEVSVFVGKGLVTGASDEFLPKDGIGEAAQFVSPTGLWGDGTNLYVADTRLIRKVALATGEVTSIAGNPLSYGITDGVGADAGFAELRGIAGDGRYLYVIESNSPRVRRIAIDSGEVTTVAGEFGKPGSEDGIGSAAHFDAPGGIWSDGTNVDLSDNGLTIRRLAPVSAPTSTSNFALSSNGSTFTSTRGMAPQIAVGYAEVHLQTTAVIAGTAIFAYRKNGVLVTEAGVPATRPLLKGTIYTASGQFVRTGVAIANPNATAVTFSFSYTDENGVDFGAGTTVIPANGQISRFLDEPPFNTATAGRSRTFSFNASAPVGVIALRGFTNERSDLLLTTLPVTDLSTAAARVSFPHFATGGNWATNVVLVNPSDAVAEGDLVFLQDDGSVYTTTSYSIAPRSAFDVRMAEAGASIRTGQVRVNPKAGHAVPDGVLVFSYQSDGITVTETSIPAVESGSQFSTYAEATSSVQTGLALANSGASDAIVALSLMSVTGEDLGIGTTLRLAPNGHTALFLREISGFASLRPDFRGVLRITTDRSTPVSVVTLRSRYNERGDFLVSTIQAADEQRGGASSELIFPHIADGGGYTTDFVLFSASGPATGMLQFNSQSGEPLSIQLR